MDCFALRARNDGGAGTHRRHVIETFLVLWYFVSTIQFKGRSKKYGSTRRTFYYSDLSG